MPIRPMWFYAVCLALLLACGPARAACVINTQSLNFGVYDPTSGTAKDATASLTIDCSANSGAGNAIVSLSRGGATSYAARRMASGSKRLTYQIYTNAARSTIWGDGSSGTSRITVTGLAHNGGHSIVNYYGRIAAHTVVAPGYYTDTIIATVTF